MVSMTFAVGYMNTASIETSERATERDFVAAAAADGDDGVLSEQEAKVLFRELSVNGKDSSIPFAEVLLDRVVNAALIAVLRGRCRKSTISTPVHAVVTTFVRLIPCWH